MIFRLILSLLVALVVAAGAARAWSSLREFESLQITRTAESESYAARSQLVRNVERMITALRSAQTFWTTYGRIPRQDWASEADIEMAGIAGVKLILWDDPANRTRFARNAENPVFDYRPDDQVWQGYRDILERAGQATRNTMAGPFLAPDGKATFEIYLVGGDPANTGQLVAIFDAHAFLHSLLQDESPGYAVKVLWRNVMLYERGQPAKGSPPEWTREGKIQTSLGSLWTVVHAPTDQLVESISAPAIDLILLLGLVIAVLMATLTFENWRAYSRAGAAEKAERNLAELNRNLEQQIEARTRELAARTADLQTIADSVAHDMRNPLNAISINLGLFEARNQASLSADDRAVLSRIPPAVRQMADILDRLIGLSTVAHSIFRRERLDMRELALEVFDSLQASEPPPKVELSLGDLLPVEADEKLVRILLLNLFANAFKYTRERTQRRIRFDSATRDGVVVFRLEDNGIGFDQGSADRIFKAFQRLDDGKVASGLGLGLAISARVVGRHRGRIWAEAVVGEKAVFYFTLQPEYVADPPPQPA